MSSMSNPIPSRVKSINITPALCFFFAIIFDQVDDFGVYKSSVQDTPITFCTKRQNHPLIDSFNKFIFADSSGKRFHGVSPAFTS